MSPYILDLMNFKNDENNCFPPFSNYYFVTVLTPCHFILSVVVYVIAQVGVLAANDNNSETKSK